MHSRFWTFSLRGEASEIHFPSNIHPVLISTRYSINSRLVLVQCLWAKQVSWLSHWPSPAKLSWLVSAVVQLAKFVADFWVTLCFKTTPNRDRNNTPAVDSPVSRLQPRFAILNIVYIIFYKYAFAHDPLYSKAFFFVSYFRGASLIA